MKTLSTLAAGVLIGMFIMAWFPMTVWSTIAIMSVLALIIQYRLWTLVWTPKRSNVGSTGPWYGPSRSGSTRSTRLSTGPKTRQRRSTN